MMTFWTGLLLIMAGGAMQGSFTIPQKFLRGWAWEAGWLLYSVAAMVIFPWLLVALIVPRPLEVYANVGFAPLALAALFGAGWGIGSVLFGLGVARVGTALAFALIISLTAAVGSIVPLAVLHTSQLATQRGAMLFLGLAIVIAGVVLCSRAGMLKETSLYQKKTGVFARGLAICIASGITSPMFNFSIAFGDPISREAARMGANPANASIAIIAVAISAGFVINAGYCIYLLKKNRSWKAPSAGGVLLTFLMGFLWLFGMFFYGIGQARIGQYGPVLGWPLFMTVIVLVANLWGLLTGEWRGAGPKALRYLAAGNAVMIVALVVIAWGGQG
ncbi:MAG: L-rhamnose/proton symporter RhaT [Bryobacteraceae bacterium]